MSSGGLLYYKVETNRYDDIRIRKLKKSCGANGIAIYDYILCQIYKGKGYYVVADDDFLFYVADYLNVKQRSVSEVISYACATGLFDKELRIRESVLTSVAIQERWVQIVKKTKRYMPVVDERFWLIDNPDVCQHLQIVGRHLTDVGLQTEKVCKQMQNARGLSINKEIEKENPPRTPYKEKDKEKELPKNACAKKTVADDVTITVSLNEPAAQILTPAEKRERAIGNCAKRMDDFYNSLIPFVEQYGKEMIREFFDYWSEPTRSGTQMRYELERTFELTRRLATWARRRNAYQDDRIRIRKSNTSRTISDNAATSSNRVASDRYAEISDFIGATII